MKRKNLVLGVLVGLTLAGFSSIGFAKDLGNQPAPVSDTTQQAFPGFSDKLNNLLMDQLAALGYDSAVMAEEAKAIDSIKDATEQAKATDWFYNKYQTMAVQGLYRMAALAKNPEAEDWLINVEKALQASSPTPHGNLPQSIFDIYQQIDGSQTIAVLSATDSSCITPMVQAGCFLALLGNEECAYVADHPTSALFGSIASTEQQFPVLPDVGASTWGQRYLGWYHGFGIADSINVLMDYHNIEHGRSNRTGFHWPLKATDHTMCIDLQLLGYSSADSSIPHVISSISAGVGAGAGYASTTSAWSMTLDGAGGITRPGLPISDCSFFHQVSSGGTFSPNESHQILSRVHDFRDGNIGDFRSCRFTNLDEVYNRTYPTQRFPATQDPETWGAASIDITSNASTGMHILLDGSADESTLFKIKVYGVLVVRDR